MEGETSKRKAQLSRISGRWCVHHNHFSGSHLRTPANHKPRSCLRRVTRRNSVRTLYGQLSGSPSMVVAHWFMLQVPPGPGSVHDMNLQGSMVPLQRYGLHGATMGTMRKLRNKSGTSPEADISASGLRKFTDRVKELRTEIFDFLSWLTCLLDQAISAAW